MSSVACYCFLTWVSGAIWYVLKDSC